MKMPLRVLMLEDSENDALLTIRALKKGGYEPEYMRMETAEAMRTALQEKTWDLILCDYQMPQFNGLTAVALLKEAGIDIPLIIVSGAIGEEMAVECMRLGARDYIMKGNLSRLASAVDRELKEAESRRQRKRAEKKLLESEGKYRNILESIQDGYFEVDIAGNITFFNDSVCRMVGITRAEMMGMNYRQYTDKENSRLLYQAFNKVFRTEEPSKGTSYEIIGKDGTKLSIESIVSLIKNTSGQPIGFRGIMRNITERKLADEKLQQTLESLRKAVGTTIQVLAYAVETRDPYTAGHQVRSADLARTIGTEIGLPQDKIDAIRIAGSIHDIGKLSIPAEILSKPNKLSDIEFSLIKEHARKGYEMLKDVESPWPLAEIVYQHHERMDGSGYPRNLKGEAILIEARILAVADVMEAMASHRPYRPGLGIDAALNEIEKNKGIFYDDAVASACLRLFREKGFQLAND
jgi:PAS domain S-box-containing protein